MCYLCLSVKTKCSRLLHTRSGDGYINACLFDVRQPSFAAEAEKVEVGRIISEQLRYKRLRRLRLKFSQPGRREW